MSVQVSGLIRSITSEFKSQRDARDTMIQLEEDEDSEPTGAGTGKKYFLEPPPAWMKQKDDVENMLSDVRNGSM